MARRLTRANPSPLQDKLGQRGAFARHGVPSPPFAPVETVDGVRDCGRRWGYPLILKPARGTASHGVRRIDTADQIAGGLAAARSAARASGVERVLAEGYLDGPDIAVESMVLAGVTHHVAFWQSGWTGNLWQAAAPLGPALRPHLAAIGEVVARANEALGLHWAATSNELRLTAAGPMIVEVNARLGGGPCEEAIRLHSGVDRVRSMLLILRGERPDPTPRRSRPVVQTIIRATRPGPVLSIEVPPNLIADPAARLRPWLAPGVEIVDPDATDLGWLLLHGEAGDDALALLDRATAWARRIRVHQDGDAARR